MKFNILTANIALGLPRMNNLLVNVIGHLVFHGRFLLTLFLNPKSIKNQTAQSNPCMRPPIFALLR